MFHGADSVQAGTRQAWTGLDTDTITSDATSALAVKLGVDRATAERIGDGIDLVAPLAISGGLAAARVIAIRQGQMNIVPHELAGGHTISRHIYKSEDIVRLRLATFRWLPAASSFTSLITAEKAIGIVMRSNRQRIARWAASAKVGDTEQFVGFYLNAGTGVVRSSGRFIKMHRVRVVLKKHQAESKLYYVLTSFPVP